MMNLVQRSILALAFLVTALLKILSPPTVAAELQALGLGEVLLPIIVGLELLLAVSLLLPPTWRAGSWLALSFSVGALAYLTWLQVHGIDLKVCGCFGSREVGLDAHVAVLIGLLGLSALLLAGSETSTGTRDPR